MIHSNLADSLAVRQSNYNSHTVKRDLRTGTNKYLEGRYCNCYGYVVETCLVCRLSDNSLWERPCEEKTKRNISNENHSK